LFSPFLEKITASLSRVGAGGGTEKKNSSSNSMQSQSLDHGD
jgi:hypothetical protein